jgi:hypothetical protein
MTECFVRSLPEFIPQSHRCGLAEWIAGVPHITQMERKALTKFLDFVLR